MRTEASGLREEEEKLYAELNQIKSEMRDQQELISRMHLQVREKEYMKLLLLIQRYVIGSYLSFLAVISLLSIVRYCEGISY